MIIFIIHVTRNLSQTKYVILFRFSPIYQLVIDIECPFPELSIMEIINLFFKLNYKLNRYVKTSIICNFFE